VAERLCRHEPCGCTPSPGDEFCDPRCATASVESGHTECVCEHPECRPAQAKAFDPHEPASPHRPEDVSSPPETDPERL